MTRMAITRWDPFRDLTTLHKDMNRLFGVSFGDFYPEARGDWAPVVDVFETPEKVTLAFELPGLNRGDIDITVEDQMLTVSGERKFYNEVNEEDFHRVERRFGTFLRRITLPKGCDLDGIDASMLDGVLTIELPKIEQTKARKIEVRSPE